MIPISVFANRNRLPYRDVLMMVIAGRIAGAERRGGRWYVPDTAAPADLHAAAGCVPPEVGALRRLVSDLELHPFAATVRGMV